MTVAKASEITATSGKSYADAIQVGIQRSSTTLDDIIGAWIADQGVVVDEGQVTGYRVRRRITCVLEH